MNSILRDKRMASALSSKGMSSEPIYELVMSYIHLMQLQGDALEFGAGAGSLIGQITGAGITGSLTAADILPPPEDLPDHVKWVQADLNGPLELPENSFDWIVSTEVIEHLENPRAVFRELFRLLRPGGKLIVTTPCQESIRALIALIFGGHFVAFLDSCYPAHITALLRKDLERICLETGFEKPEFAYTDIGGVPKLPRLHWQDISFKLLKGRLFSDNMMLVAEKPTLST
jgi:2-polyprenyl-3-methyl-5-hydroxy-6-metoxy-1,4-benzoquinol methylase